MGRSMAKSTRRDARTCAGLKNGKNDAYLHGRGLHEPGRAPKHGAGRGSGFRASFGRVTARPALSFSGLGTPNGPTSRETTQIDDDDSRNKLYTFSKDGFI